MAIREFDDEQLEALARSVAKALSEHRSPRRNWDRWSAVTALLMSLVGLVFTVGLNWSQVSTNSRDIATANQRIDKIELRIQEISSDMAIQSTSIQKDLGDIKAQLGKIEGALSRR